MSYVLHQEWILGYINQRCWLMVNLFCKDAFKSTFILINLSVLLYYVLSIFQYQLIIPCYYALHQEWILR